MAIPATITNFREFWTYAKYFIVSIIKMPIKTHVLNKLPLWSIINVGAGQHLVGCEEEKQRETAAFILSTGLWSVNPSLLLCRFPTPPQH